MIGTLLGQYRIVEQVGAGGMGVVYRAHDEKLGRDVAIKVLAPGMLDNPEARRQFRVEARALARINHPNIATLYDAREEEGTDFLVMEFVPGLSLEDRLHSTRFSAPEIVGIAKQVAEGLAAAHKQGVLHRDLKPGNLRLTPEGKVKILDFGLARTVAHASETGQTVTATQVLETGGTIPYMSPEQLRGEPGDERSDLWAVGAILYELACNARPFGQGTTAVIIANILQKSPPPPRLQSGVPAELDRIIMRCLEKDPARRYQSAEELLRDLANAAAGAGTTATAPVGEGSAASHAMEIAHVLFMDIVSYSTLPMDEQERVLRELREIVLGLREVRSAQQEDRLISLPTGDGMALVFFGDAEAPVRCALDLARALKSQLQIPLRMGINSGPVYVVVDINGNRNVAGAGINMAQRVMDCGDAGHILVAKSVADVLGQVRTWQPLLHDLGVATVKHDARISIFNLYRDDAGNPKVPQKLSHSLGTSAGRLRMMAEWTAVAAAIAVAAVLGYQWKRMYRPSEPTIAVLGFKNETGDANLNWVATDLNETLSAQLGAAKGVRTVPAEEVAQMKTEFSLPPADAPDGENVMRLHDALGATYVVLGEYAKATGANGSLVFDLKLHDRMGRQVAHFHEVGNEADYSSVVRQAADRIREKLGKAPLAEMEASELSNVYPTDPAARRLYFEALEKLRSLDGPATLGLLQQAVQKDADSVVIHSALADAYGRLRKTPEALAEAKRAQSLAEAAADRLPFEFSVSTAARAEEMSNNWEAAIQDFGRLFHRYPSLSYGLKLANAQMRGSHPKEALDTLQELSKMPSPIGTDPRIELLRAQAYESMNDSTSQMHSAQIALDEAQKRGARMMAANAELQLCWAARTMGQAQAAADACHQAQTAFKSAGDPLAAAAALNAIATRLGDQGQYQEALDFYKQVIEIQKAAGNQLDLAGANQNAARMLLDMGKPEEAATYIEDAIAAAAASHDLKNEVLARLTRGAMLFDMGRATDAANDAEAALQKARELDSAFYEATALANLATYKEGIDSKSALVALNTQLAVLRKLGNVSDTATCLTYLGDLHYRRGEIDAARGAYAEVIRIGDEQGDKAGSAGGYLGMARVDAERGSLEEAEREARKALEGFASSAGNSDAESSANSVLVHILTSEGKTSDAAAALERIRKIDSKDLDTQFENRIAIAAYLEVNKDVNGAVNQIAKLPREASSKGREFYALEADLMLVKLERGARPRAELAGQLKDTERKASRIGYGLLVQRAGKTRLLNF